MATLFPVTVAIRVHILPGCFRQAKLERSCKSSQVQDETIACLVSEVLR